MIRIWSGTVGINSTIDTAAYILATCRQWTSVRSYGSKNSMRRGPLKRTLLSSLKHITIHDIPKDVPPKFQKSAVPNAAFD